MIGKRGWTIAYYALFAAFLATAALNMLHVHAGFFTNHAADLVVPAWLYLVARNLGGQNNGARLLRSTIGRSAELAAMSLFVASAMTEISQRYWPRGFFSGRFDPLDIVAYGVGLAVCYTAERLSNRPHIAVMSERRS